jgi:protease-4
MKKKSILALSVSILFFAASATAFSFNLDQGKGAMVSLSGTVQPSSSGSIYSTGGITPQHVRDMNEKVREGNYDAVVYEINSGGGTVVASKEVMRAIDDMDIPTVCRFRDISASGAYLFAMGCDKIVADSATLTGSIGVKSSYLEYSGLLERYGVEYVNISSGKHKDISSPYQNATEREKEILQEKADKIHRQFLELVQDNRNVSEEEMERIETGNIFLGSEAEELGLVDRLGGRETAFTVAENMTSKKEIKFSKVESQQSFNFLSMLSANSFVENLLNLKEVPLKATVY